MRSLFRLCFILGVFTVLAASCSKDVHFRGPSPTSQPQYAALEKHESEYFFLSENNVEESCVILSSIPSGDYSKKDLKKEEEYCAMDFTNTHFAVCPKTWSTSPATMIYDLSESEYNGDPQSYENSSFCGDPNKKKGKKVKTFAKFKSTMNHKGTSGTFSKSSILYYHFSRYFDTEVEVPVAVHREMDKQVHRSRIAPKGYEKSKSKMIKSGWSHFIKSVDTNGRHYAAYGNNEVEDLFTEDLEKIYGSLVRGKGERYGPVINGLRTAGWGLPEGRQFMETAPFRALRSSLPLDEAIAKGLRDAAADSSRMAKNLVGVNNQQMALWMRELSEIALLDYIFNQQDRVGNIDFEWYWVYVEKGEVEYKKEKRNEYEEQLRFNEKTGVAYDIPVPQDLSIHNPILVQRTRINDNDAGGLPRYANRAKSLLWLESLRHFSTKIFIKLMDLDADLQSQGPLHEWLSGSTGLTDSQVKEIVKNTHSAARILRQSCEQLRFDLDDVDNYLAKGARTEVLDCAAYQ